MLTECVHFSEVTPALSTGKHLVPEAVLRRLVSVQVNRNDVSSFRDRRSRTNLSRSRSGVLWTSANLILVAMYSSAAAEYLEISKTYDDLNVDIVLMFPLSFVCASIHDLISLCLSC